MIHWDYFTITLQDGYSDGPTACVTVNGWSFDDDALNGLAELLDQLPPGGRALAVCRRIKDQRDNGEALVVPAMFYMHLDALGTAPPQPETPPAVTFDGHLTTHEQRWAVRMTGNGGAFGLFVEDSEGSVVYRMTPNEAVSVGVALISGATLAQVHKEAAEDET